MALAALIVVLVLLGPLSGPASAASPVVSADASFLSLLNTLRSTLGLATLTLDPQLSGVARAWSVDMADSGTMSHNPNLATQVTGWSNLGENVGYGGSVGAVFDALVASPPHMRNMSDGAFTMIGIGTVSDASGRLWTTHVFEGRVAATATRADPPPPARRPALAPAPKPAPPPAAQRTPPPPPSSSASTVPASVAPVPTTAAPVPTTVPETVVPQPTAAASDATPVLPPIVPVSSTSSQRASFPLVVGAGLLALVALGGAGSLKRRMSASAGSGQLPR